MSQVTLFVQVQGDPTLVEVTVAANVTDAELHSALSRAGVHLTPDVQLFIDESDDFVPAASDRPVPGLKHGARVHVSRCRRIKTTVNFLDKTAERAFPPGTRIRSVKTWAAREFHLDHKDAAEHALQICGSAVRPATDTPLHALVRGHECAVCFDLVPEKRVEG